MSEEPKKHRSESSGSWGGHMRSGALWMIALRWSIRLTGLVSTVILARLLVPRDFGIVAMAMIVVGSLEIFSQTGQLLVLIRLRTPTRVHYDTAWTISFLIGVAIALAILAVSPFTVAYFHEPRAIPVMQFLALRAVMGGLENVGTVNFRRDLEFNRFFAYNVYPKLISFTATITAAVIWRNYWALVLGMLTGQFVRVILSYAMHPYRPRFTLSATSEIWSFSIWTFVRTIGEYLLAQIDQIVVGGIAGSPAMGRYSVAADVASSPSREINEPMVAVLYPVMSRLQDDPNALRGVFLRTLEWSAVICISASVGVALVAEDLANLVLGPKWIGIGPLMAWLAIGAGLMGLSSGAYSLFDALGRPQLGARMTWIRTGMLALGVILVALRTHSLIDIAMIRALAAIVFLPGLYYVVGRLIGVSFSDYAKCLWRPLAAAAGMAAAVVAVNEWMPLPGDARLFVDVAAGALIFLALSLALWAMSGRPASPEADAVATLRRWASPYLPIT